MCLVLSAYGWLCLFFDTLCTPDILRVERARASILLRDRRVLFRRVLSPSCGRWGQRRGVAPCLCSSLNARSPPLGQRPVLLGVVAQQTVNVGTSAPSRQNTTKARPRKKFPTSPSCIISTTLYHRTNVIVSYNNTTDDANRAKETATTSSTTNDNYNKTLLRFHPYRHRRASAFLARACRTAPPAFTPRSCETSSLRLTRVLTTWPLPCTLRPMYMFTSVNGKPN